MYGMNLSNELKNKAQWVAQLMKADGVTADQLTPEIIMAYLDEVGRRIEKMQTEYLTKPKVREGFDAVIIQLCRQ